ncbi:conjugal transfer protein TraO [Flavobacterium croceum]|uniref:conjugal transfer protein TraO n=1 Tax=Flavobacterium croceum TaxID=370975 RepID=UPI0014728EA6|nr:conjugal transfer protein TraO [Flavobacterium croceum]
MICIITFQTRAQDAAIAVSGGLTQNGFAGMLSYNYYYNRYQSSFIQGSILFTSAKSKSYKIPYNEFTFNAGMYFLALKNRSEAIKITVGAGGSFGYESINNGSNELSTGEVIVSKQKFIHGVFAGVDADFYLNDRLSFVVKANEYYHFNSDIGKFFPYMGVGCRIFLDY